MTIRWAAAALCAGLSWSACATDSRSLLWQMDRELQTAAAQPDLDPAALARLAQAGRQLQVEVRGDAALARKAAQVAALADALHARAAHPDPQRAPPVPVATGPLLHRAATSTMGASCANAIALQPEQALRVSLPAASSIWVRLSLPPGRGAGFSTRGSQADAALAVYRDCRELDQPIAAGDDDYGLQASVALAADARRATWVARVDNVGAAGEIVILGGTATQLAGRVTRAVDGSPVASIVIGAFRDYGTFLSYVGTAQTNASGDYVLSIFPGEAATYYARTGDYSGQNLDVAMLAYAGVPCSVRDWYYINSCVGTLTPIVPPLGGSVTGIDFALPPTATIAGRVRSETSGAPVFGAQVTVYDGSGNTAGYQYTDAAGRYRVLGLGGGTFYARADAPDHDSELFENIPCAFQACSPASGTPIAAAAGTTAIVDFDLVRQLLVNVNVTLEGQPLTGFLNGYLDLLNANGAPVASASIFGGTVRIGPVPPGNYYLRALPSVYQPQFAARLYPTVGCASDCFSELASATPIAISSAQGPVSVAFDLQAPDETGAECERHQGGRAADAMACDELARAVPARRRMREHRARFEVALEVVGERRGVGVTMRRLLGERLAQHGVEVAAQRRACVAAHGPRAEQQLVRDDAERVDVGGGRHGAAGELLGCRIRRREHGAAGARGCVVVIAEQLRHAEVEQSRPALAVDEDVRGLQVAVHHQLAVRGRDGAGNRDEQREPCALVERVRARVLGDRRAVDVLDDEERDAGGRHAAVDQPRDVGMGERSEHAALAFVTRCFSSTEDLYLRPGVALTPALGYEMCLSPDALL